MAKRALITGITGQDGSYLAELLLEKGYEVFGVVRRLSAPNSWQIDRHGARDSADREHAVLPEQYLRRLQGLRPLVDHLIGDSSKAKQVLGWEQKVDFKQLVEMMVDADMERLSGTMKAVTEIASIK